MAWVAVDKSGEEFVYAKKPIRSTIGRYWLPDDYSYVKIPKGSIKKLIGRKLTWKDSPVWLRKADILSHSNNHPIKGFTEEVRRSLIEHCKRKIDSAPCGVHMRLEHEIFLELLNNAKDLVEIKEE